MNTKTYITLNLIIVLITALFCSISCKTTFTSEIRNGLKPQSVPKLQFYLSDKIILSIDRETSVKHINKNGELKEVNTTEHNKIIFKKNTKGIVLNQIDQNTIRVSFDKDDNIGLMFGNQNGYGEYKLISEYPWENNQTQVAYNGQLYWTDNNSNNIFLKIRKVELNKETEQTKTASGIKIK